jgi:hypothetical protein
MWIDIGLTLLLTLRIAWSSRAVPRLLDSNQDAGVPEDQDEEQGYLHADEREANEHSSRKSLSESYMDLAITYSCNTGAGWAPLTLPFPPI